MNLQKKYWKSDADGNAGIEDGSLDGVNFFL